MELLADDEKALPVSDWEPEAEPILTVLDSLGRVPLARQRTPHSGAASSIQRIVIEDTLMDRWNSRPVHADVPDLAEQGADLRLESLEREQRADACVVDVGTLPGSRREKGLEAPAFDQSLLRVAGGPSLVASRSHRVVGVNAVQPEQNLLVGG